MTAVLPQIFMFLVVLALLAALWARPESVAAIVVAVVVVAAGIAVSWRDVVHYREQKASNAAVAVQAQETTPGVSVPAPNHPRAGS